MKVRFWLTILPSLFIPDPFLYRLQVMRFKTVVLQWKSGRLPHVSLSYTTHAFKCNDTHTQTHMKPDRCALAHTKKWQRHTGNIQLACLHPDWRLADTPVWPLTHTLLCQPLSHCSSCTELSVAEGKKLKNTLLTLVLGCHLTYTECISNSWEYLVSACSILRQHAHPGSHFRLLKACILDQSQAERWTFKAFKNSSC